MTDERGGTDDGGRGRAVSDQSLLPLAAPPVRSASTVSTDATVSTATTAGSATTTAALSARFDSALVYARQVHEGQLRKGTDIPYVAHLLSVAALVLEAGGGEEEAVAALLHDAAEDHGGEARLADIADRFGERVAAVCRACSDALPDPGAAKGPWRSRKEAYLHHLETTDDHAGLLVSAADKLHNARAVLADYRTCGPALWGRFKGSRDGTLWYYRRVADILAVRLRGLPIAVELAETVERLEGSVVATEGWAR